MREYLSKDKVQDFFLRIRGDDLSIGYILGEKRDEQSYRETLSYLPKPSYRTGKIEERTFDMPSGTTYC